MRKRIPILALMLFLILATAGVVLASNGVEIPRWVLSGGATESTGGDVILRATLGQPVVGVVSGGDITLGQGYWFGGTRGYNIYLPLIIRN